MVLNLLEEQVKVVTCLVLSTLRPVHIIDGTATVQVMKAAGKTTFGELAMKYFTSIVLPLSQSSCSKVHVMSFSSPEAAIHLASAMDRDLGPAPIRSCH